MNDKGLGILKVLIILTFFSIIGGRMLRWLMFPFPILVILPLYLKGLTIIVCLVGGLIGYILFRGKIIKFYKLNFFIKLFNIFISII